MEEPPSTGARKPQEPLRTVRPSLNRSPDGSTNPRIGPIIILAGVAGSGKTTLGRLLAEDLHGVFLDADDLHSPEAKAKMGRGEALTDTDRQPWLNAIKARLLEVGEYPLILACSALKRHFRQALSEGLQRPPIWFWLAAPQAEIKQRLTQRLREGSGHFFAPELADSQFSAAEADPKVDLGLHFLQTTAPAHHLVREVLTILGK